MAEPAYHVSVPVELRIAFNTLISPRMETKINIAADPHGHDICVSLHHRRH